VTDPQGEADSDLMGAVMGTWTTPIVGRQEQLDRLGKAIEQASDHMPCAWFVHGEPGVGKSRLVLDVCARAEAQGFAVLRGRCVHFGAASSPYAPLVTALEGWLGTADERNRNEVMAELDVIAEAAPGEGSQTGRVLRVMERLFTRIASYGPMVLVVDDLQWADITSLDVLAYLVAGFRDQRMALIATYRDTELPDGHPLHGWVADMRRMPAVHDLALERLDESGTEEQLSLLFGRRPSAGLVREVHARSQGNPYLTELLVRDLPAAADTLPDDLPVELSDVLLASWHRLRAMTREVIRLLAVGGRPLSYATFAAVAEAVGHDPAVVAASLAEGFRAGVLLVERGDSYWFRHPLLAEVLTGTLQPGESTVMHAAFVRALAGTTPRDEAEEMRLLADLALHCERSAHPDEAFVYTMRAAECAGRLQGYPEQARHLLRAVHLLPQVDTRVVADAVGGELPLLERAAFACSRSGELLDAHRLVSRGLARVNREQDVLRATRLLTEWCELVWTNQMVEQPPLARLIEAVELSSAVPDSEEHAVALARLAQAESAFGMQRDATRHAALAVEAAQRSGSASGMSVALSARSLVHLREESAHADSAEAYAWARRSRDPVVIAGACMARAQYLEEQGRLQEVLPVEAEGFAESTATGSRGYQAYFAGRAAMDSLRQGRFAEAQNWVREGLAVRSVGRGAVQVRRAAATIAIREGRLSEAADHIERILELSPRFESRVGDFGPMLLAEYALASGEPDTALGVVERNLAAHAVGAPREADVMLVWAARAAGDLARAGRDAGDGRLVDSAGDRLDDLLRLRRQFVPLPFVSSGVTDSVSPAVGLVFEAERSRSDGSSGDVGRWRAAAEACERAGLRWQEAVAWRWLAAALLDEGGSRAEASRALRTSHEMAAQMGALTLREDVETLARSARVVIWVPGEPEEASNHGSVLDSLTRREREVLAHLVRGSSYAEIADALFISDKTVSVHVSNILRKTGARNRVEASALGRRQGVS
jgi:DNA-binding CsgD family transcriptional regulator